MNRQLSFRTLCVVLSALFLAPAAAMADAVVNITYAAATTTRFPLPFPSGSVATSFTSYTGSAFPFATGTFEVGATGTYSVAVGGIGGGVGVFVLQGAFAPNSASDPVTPLANFLAGTQAPPTIPSIVLQAGVQYSYLVVVSAGSGTGTVTIDGGCVAVGATTCSPLSLSMSLGVPFTTTLTATGGTPPHTFSVSAGTLPAGLSLNGVTGQLSGTPMTLGPFSFTILETDSFGGTNVQAYSGMVTAPVPSMPFVALVALALMLAGLGYLKVKTAA
jgi:hypothetical protein